MSGIKDPLFYLTEQLKELTAAVAKYEEQVKNIVSDALILRGEVNRWKNLAGIMHEAIREGDCQAAKSYYEKECAPWGSNHGHTEG